MKQAMIMMLFIFSFINGMTANRYAVVSGNYEDAIWAATPGGSAGSAAVPTATEDVFIPSGITVYMNSVAEKANSLTLDGVLEYLTNRNLVITNQGFVQVNSGASIIFSTNGLLKGGGNSNKGVTVTIAAGARLTTANPLGFNTGTGNTVLTGSIAVKPGNMPAPYYDPAISYTFNAGSAQVTGDAVFEATNITINNPNGVTATNDLTVTTLTTDASGILDMGTNRLIVADATNHAGTLLTQNVSATPVSENVTWGGIVKYNSASSQSIVAGNYADIDGTGGDRILSSTGIIGIAGTLTIGAGTYTVTNSTVDFNGNTDQTIPDFDFYDLIISNNGTKYIPASTTVTCQSININDNAGIAIDADGGGQLNVLE